MLFKYNNTLNKQTQFDWPLWHITNTKEVYALGIWGIGGMEKQQSLELLLTKSLDILMVLASLKMLEESHKERED